MIKFKKIKIDKQKNIFQNIQYLGKIYNLIKKYNNYLNDDYYSTYDLFEAIINLVIQTSPFFWVILQNEEFVGFVYLENLIGNKKHLHSAEIVTAFKRKFWGKTTKICAKKFITYCFKKLKFRKLKAVVFKENFRTEAILKSCKMELEAELKAETIKNKRLQDIKIYSIIRGKRKWKLF